MLSLAPDALAGDATTDVSGVATLTYKVNIGRDGKGPFDVTASATFDRVSTTEDATATFEVR